MDHEPSFANDTAGVSVDGTGQVGTYFYTAPEIEQAWPHINEKVKVLDDQCGLFVLFYTCDFMVETFLIFIRLKIDLLFLFIFLFFTCKFRL